MNPKRSSMTPEERAEQAFPCRCHEDYWRRHPGTHEPTWPGGNCEDARDLCAGAIASAESESFQRGFEAAREAALAIAENMAHSAYVASMKPGLDQKAAMKAESLAFAAKTLADEIRTLTPTSPPAEMGTAQDGETK